MKRGVDSLASILFLGGAVCFGGCASSGAGYVSVDDSLDARDKERKQMESDLTSGPMYGLKRAVDSAGVGITLGRFLVDTLTLYQGVERGVDREEQASLVMDNYDKLLSIDSKDEFNLALKDVGSNVYGNDNWGEINGTLWRCMTVRADLEVGDGNGHMSPSEMENYRKKYAGRPMIDFLFLNDGL